MEHKESGIVDLDRLAILLKRRYNIFRDIKSATDELSLALSRNDEVSAELVLEIRQDGLERCEENWQELRLMAEEGTESAEYMRRLVFSELKSSIALNPDEEKILELRSSIEALLNELKLKDRMLNTRIAKDKSYYQTEESK